MALFRINRHPSRLQLLVFAAAWLVVVALIAFRGGDVRGWPLALAGAVALVPLVLWVVAPEALRWLFVGLSTATFPIGFALSYVVLVILYYGVFTPVRLLLRLFRRDPLARRFDRSAPTYWVRRPAEPAPETYFRQH